jgi:hypothetical protein
VLNLLRVFSVLIFSAHVALFVLTLIPDVRLSWWAVLPLHLGTMVSFGAMVLALASRSYALRVPEPGLSRLERDWRAASTVPLRVWIVGILGAALLLCVTTHFAAPINAGASVKDGKFVLQSHGRVIGELTEEEYWRIKTEEERMFTSVCLVFSWLPLVFFGLGPGEGGLVPTSTISAQDSGQPKSGSA